MLVSAWCALVAAVLYGVSDFAGSLAARSIRVFPATVIAYCAATVVVLVAVPAGGGTWSAPALWWGGAAGAFTVLGLLAFYAALASGSMSLMSALIAAIESAVPVLASILAGQQLVWWAWFAIALAVAGGVLLSVERPGGVAAIAPRTAVLAVGSGLLLGASVLSLDAAPHQARVIPAGAETVVGLALLGVLALLARWPLTARTVRSILTVLDDPTPDDPTPDDAMSGDRMPGGPVRAEQMQRGEPTLVGEHTLVQTVPAATSRLPTVALAAVGGALLAAANMLLVVALHAGSLAVAGVLVSLYPLSTILLARLLLRELLTRSQLVGIGLALLACVLLSQA